jgi:cation:H+ antiporter
MMLLAVAEATVMASDVTLGESVAQYSRTDGLVFLLFFIVFIYYTVGDLIAQRSERHRGIENGEVSPAGASGSTTEKHAFQDLFKLVLGLLGLLLGADLTVDGGVAIALALGVPEVVVGLTVISVGTSLPELVATLSAVRRGEMAIAVGGVVGSNIFNILLVCGLTSTIMPIAIPAGGMLDLAVTGILSLALLLTARTHSRLILRWEGAGLLLSYLTYMVWRTMQMN